ncbi:hypothetical protein ISCGN_032234 [Ixodes scapularis]
MAALLVSLVFLASRQANAACIVPEEQFAELRNASEDVRKIIAFFTSGNEKGNDPCQSAECFLSGVPGYLGQCFSTIDVSRTPCGSAEMVEEPVCGEGKGKV